MLVLSRHVDEDICIGSGDEMVVVKVVSIQGDRVRLGISGPKATPVHRREVYEAIQRESLQKKRRDP